jgi:hypothetical protein
MDGPASVLQTSPPAYSLLQPSASPAYDESMPKTSAPQIGCASVQPSPQDSAPLTYNESVSREPGGPGGPGG